MTEQTFVLPDVGEGLTEAEIVQWRVAPGDSVAVNDVIVEIETAKSLVELPSPYSGTVGELLASEGSTVEVGAPIITIGSADAGTPAPAEPVSVPEPSDPAGPCSSATARVERCRLGVEPFDRLRDRPPSAP